MKQLGIILIIIGLVLSIYTTFSYFTKEKVLDLGRVEINKEKEHSVSWSPIAGIALIAIGGLIFWQASKK